MLRVEKWPPQKVQRSVAGSDSGPGASDGRPADSDRGPTASPEGVPIACVSCGGNWAAVLGEEARAPWRRKCLTNG